MDVILREDFPSLGYVGDKIKVKRGYARNFLIPKGLAVEASLANDRILKHRLAQINARKMKLKGQAEEFKGKLELLSLEFTLRTSVGTKTFGSITAKDIDTELIKQGIELNRKQIRVLEPIRKVGEFRVPIKLHSEVTAQLLIKVISAGGEAVQKSLGKGKGKSKKAAQSSDEQLEGSNQEQVEASESTDAPKKKRERKHKESNESASEA